MSDFPDWLPPRLEIVSFSDETYEKLYSLFVETFHPFPLHRGKRVWFHNKLDNGKEVMFWHLVEREWTVPRKLPSGKLIREKQRLWDPQRASRLPWIIPILAHDDDDAVLDFNFEEGRGCVRKYLWLEEHDFLVIIEPSRDSNFRLVTSFHIDGEQNYQYYKDKYNKRLKP